jgi:cytochrome c5
LFRRLGPALFPQVGPEDFMSDSHDHAPHDAGAHEPNHEGPIKTPKQLIATVVASFLIPIMVIVLLVNYVDFGNRSAEGSTGLSAEAVAQRLRRVGSIEIRDANGPAVLRTGEQVYTGQCSACHAAGAVGAPKFGDAAAWGPRIKTGYDALLNSALKGKNAMTPQGGGEYNDLEIGRAVVYMANQGGAKFDEPKAPAAAASGADAASAPK